MPETGKKKLLQEYVSICKALYAPATFHQLQMLPAVTKARILRSCFVQTTTAHAHKSRGDMTVAS